MIVRPRPHWLLMLFVWRGSILNRILPQLCLTLTLAILVVIYHGELLHWKITLTAVPFSLVGVALAIFLGFRNSASYDRYWEARRLWGRLLIDGRNLTRQALSFGGGNPQSLIYGAIAFVHLVRHQLRATDARADLERLLPAALTDRLLQTPGGARRMLVWLSQESQRFGRDNALNPLALLELDRNISGLNEVLGGCERIAHTPLPFTYSVILHRTVYLYCLMLPFGLLDSIGVMTPVMVAFVAYTFFAIEAISDEIEEPFGTQANDLPLNAMAIDIEIALRDMLGESRLPAPLPAIDHILS